MMAAGPGLAVKFTADTAGLSRGMTKTEKLLSDVAKSTQGATSALRGLVAIELGKMFASAASSIASYVSSVRETAGELTKLAAISDTSVERFQALAVGAKSVGIEQDKLADIFKDVNDRVGDFLNTGGGPMADFFENIAPKVGVTAEQFARLSGPEALQLYVDSLQKAGVTQAEMTFYLEAMSSDLTALLPLLQNGGAGFEELAARAERLGIVLSEDQTGAITEMNNALDLVHATFEGIIGQVVGNLAPAVTAIAEEFLQFVEGYEGLGEGTGGTALADSITSALFDGAEYLADLLDSAVAGFMEFGASMQTVAAIFDFTANVFVAVAETLRFAFNIFEMIGNALLLGLGKILEGIGSWVSSDLEQAGKDIAHSAYEGMKKNGAEAGDAFVHAANAALGDRNFGREAADGGGMFAGAVSTARERYTSSRSPEAQAAREAKRAEEQAARDAAAKESERRRKEKAAMDERLKAEEENRKKLNSAMEKYAEEAEGIEKERLAKLGKVNQQALKVADIRSGGMDQFIALATGREDPAVEEARKQNRSLEKIADEIKKLGGTVEIMGAA